MMSDRTDTREALLGRGLKARATLPDGLVPEARRLVGLGIFGSLSEFSFVAVSAYLDLRATPSLHDAVVAEACRYDPGLPDPSGAVDLMLPGHMAVKVAGLVASGEFESLEAFLVRAVEAYLQLRDEPEMMQALDAATIEAALARPGVPMREAVAAFTNRLLRLPPLSGAEAVEAMRWPEAAVA